VYLKSKLEGPMEVPEYRVPRWHLKNTIVALLVAYHDITMPRVHAIHPAHLGHGLRERLPCFFHAGFQH
jgi:hypothetical protein